MLLHKAVPLLKRLWLLLMCAGVSLWVDQWSKHRVELTIPLGESVDFIALLSPYLTFTHTLNTGAAFSMLQNAHLLFIILGMAVSGFIVYYTARLPAHERYMRVGLGLILGGIIGNVVDRLRQGYVTDFIHFQIPAIGFDFAIFNGADSFLFIGVVLLIGLSLRAERTVANSVERVG